MKTYFVKVSDKQYHIQADDVIINGDNFVVLYRNGEIVFIATAKDIEYLIETATVNLAEVANKVSEELQKSLENRSK